jgi:hypothetical protein
MDQKGIEYLEKRIQRITESGWRNLFIEEENGNQET